MKYLLVGLGNIGNEYTGTRHNIGFDIADQVACMRNVEFRPDRLAYVAETSYRGRKLFLIKPSTYMNLSGRAVQYWLDKLDIPKSNLLVNVDDLNLGFGRIRVRKKGSDGGHNGLFSIQEKIGIEYNRLRMGIGSDFAEGYQSDYVLGKWDDEQKEELAILIKKAANANLDFVFRGIEFVLNNYNR